uniref:Uncharacterized protein n=1 Tax=Lotharella globosa TaxID=91324 RepID=A0A7S4DYU0_9EUKA
MSVLAWMDDGRLLLLFGFVFSDNYPAINFSAFLTRGVPQHHRKHPHESQAEDKIDQSQEDQQVHRSGFKSTSIYICGLRENGFEFAWIKLKKKLRRTIEPSCICRNASPLAT